MHTCIHQRDAYLMPVTPVTATGPELRASRLREAVGDRAAPNSDGPTSKF